jgi:phosphatidate cytidylyltransferase
LNAIPAVKSSDLKLRALSAFVMVAIAALAFVAGGLPFSIFVGLVALWALWEWWNLATKIAQNALRRGLWLAFGLAYISGATFLLIVLRNDRDTEVLVLGLIGIVIATDVGAYFAGRTIGGPKIAPSISPSKTWAGLAGGIVAASVFTVAMAVWLSNVFSMTELILSVLFGAVLAIVAQMGDFFESWMKRKAGVKDSGVMIPGHGGVLDRIDGLIPVVIMGTGLFLVMTLWSIGR